MSVCIHTVSRSASAPIVTLNPNPGEEDGSKTVRRPRAEWGKGTIMYCGQRISYPYRLESRIQYFFLGLVKRQVSNPEKEQPNPTPVVPETVEVKVTEELSGASTISISNDNTATMPVVKQEESKEAESAKEIG